MAGSWTKFRPTSEEGYADYSQYGVVCYKKGETFDIEYTDTSKVGQTFELIVGYTDEESWIGEVIATKTATVPSNGRCSYSMPLSFIDYAISDKLQGNMQKGVNQAFIGAFVYFNDEYESEQHFTVWNPEAFLSNFKLYRSDNVGNPYDAGVYITAAGHIAFDLPNSEVSGGYAEDAFLPAGKYTFSISDGVHEESETQYITNQGTEESYQTNRNGYDFKITLNCEDFDFLEVKATFLSSIEKTLQSGNYFYQSEPFIYTFSDSPIYLSSQNRGIGFGGPPIHGTEALSSVDIHWDVYFNRGVNIGDKSLLDYIYPIGSIYISTNGVSPSKLFGGTWQEIEGRFLLGASTEYPVGSEGGSANAVVVSHTHAQVAHTHTVGSDSHSHKYGYYTDRAAKGTARNTPGSTGASGTYNTTSDTHTHSVNGGATTTGAASGGVAGTGKNMPPYLVVNIWERIA